MDRKTVAKRIKESGLAPAGERSGNPVYSANEFARMAFGPAGQAGPDLDLDRYPEARKAWYQSELYKIQVQEKKGELIRESDHVRNMADMSKEMIAVLDSLPDILERDAGLEPDVVVAVIPILDAARSNLAERIRSAIVARAEKDQDDDD